MGTRTKTKGWRWKRTRYKPPATSNPKYKQAKQADLDWLLWSHSAGEICLKFLEESGFCLWSPVSYSYAKSGQQKILQQTKKRGKRLNILGLYSLRVSFDYGLKLGSFKSDSYLKLMNWQADKAEKCLATTGKITVIVQDNHPIHKSKEVRQHWNQWQEKGLYLFHLRNIESFLVRLLIHLIKNNVEKRLTNSWAASISDSIRQIKKLNLKDNKKSYYINQDDWSDYLEEAFEAAILESSIEISGGVYTPIQLEEVINKKEIIKTASALINLIYQYSAKDLLSVVRGNFINLPGGKEWLERRI